MFNVQPGEVYWAASDFGWVVGHSYIIYGPLLNGNTSIIFEGKPVRTPDAGTIWRLLAQHSVSTMFIAPTAFRAVKKEDPFAELMKGHDLSNFKALFLAGERLDPPTYSWLKDVLPSSVPVVDNWWQTESGWPMAINPLGIEEFPVKPGSATFPTPGYALKVLGPGGKEASPGETGDVVLQLPTPPGFSPTIWGNHDRYNKAYLEEYPGYYLSGDSGYLDEDGYVYVMGRIDDIINVAGHRFSTGEMEEVVGMHPHVAESAVIGIRDPLKGEIPLGLAVLKDDGEGMEEEELEKELVSLVRKEIGAVAAFKKVLLVQRLPKTRSGKILRATLRKLTEEEHVEAPPTIDDPMILEEIRCEVFGLSNPFFSVHCFYFFAIFIFFVSLSLSLSLCVSVCISLSSLPVP